MTSHELARTLLAGPDVPVVYVNQDYETGPSLTRVVDATYTEAAVSEGGELYCREEYSAYMWEKQQSRVKVVQL